LSGLLCASVLLALWQGWLYPAIHSNTRPDDRPVVIVDPGHGGIDGGSSWHRPGADVPEKDINLAIALNLRDLLEINGFHAVMIREDDRSISSPGTATVRQQKVSDIKNRLAVAEKYPDGILVSIHQNSYPASYVKGAQVFYGAKDERSTALAQTMQANFKALLDSSNDRKAKKIGGGVYLTQNAPNVSVLVECGFLSNQTEAALLADHDYQKKTAFVIFVSIVQFMAAQNG